MVGELSVDVPLELGRRLGAERGAVHVHLVPDVIPGEPAGDDRALVRQV